MGTFPSFICALVLISLVACGGSPVKNTELSYRGLIDHGDKPSNIYSIDLKKDGVVVKFSIGAGGQTREFPVKNARKEGLSISFTTVLPDEEKASTIILEKELGPETVPAKVRFSNGTEQELLLVRNH